MRKKVAPTSRNLWRSLLIAANSLFLAGSLAAQQPSVTITSPGAGTVLTGTAAVTVNASETGTSIVAVGLQIDGITFGTATNTSPYTLYFNTALYTNGRHSITATAWDAANNIGYSSPVSVSFANPNPGNPAVYGVMSGTFPLPCVSVHEALLPGARIFMSDAQTCGMNAYVWNSANNIVDTVTAPANIFCNGMDQMSDGRLLIAGGNLGSDTGQPIATTNGLSHSVRSMLIRSSILRSTARRLKLRLCCMLSPVKKVRTNCASDSGFIFGRSASIFLANSCFRLLRL